MQTEKDENAYKAIPLKIRVYIRIIIFMINILNIMLKKHKIAPYFSLESYAELLEDNLEKSDEPKLQ